MKQIVSAVSLSFFILFSTPAIAIERMLYELESPDRVIGTIKTVGLNSIDVYDENLRAVRRFVLLRSSSCRPGDRVSLYYYRDSMMVRSIKKMTLLDYSKNEQNLGYINFGSSLK